MSAAREVPVCPGRMKINELRKFAQRFGIKPKTVHEKTGKTRSKSKLQIRKELEEMADAISTSSGESEFLKACIRLDKERQEEKQRKEDARKKKEKMDDNMIANIEHFLNVDGFYETEQPLSAKVKDYFTGYGHKVTSKVKIGCGYPSDTWDICDCDRCNKSVKTTKWTIYKKQE